MSWSVLVLTKKASGLWERDWWGQMTKHQPATAHAKPRKSPRKTECVIPTLIGPFCSWGHVPKFFIGNFYIMGYNLKNVRNGKNASKIAKWSSLNPLALKSKLLRQFEFSENLEDLYGKCCWRARSCFPTTFSIQIFLFFSKFRLSFFNDGGI